MLSDDQWHQLWTEFHKHQTETLRLPIALVEALDPKLVVVGKRKSTTTIVSRRALWDALQEEGRK